MSRLQQARLANKHHMQATELALKLGAGIALTDFVMKSVPRILELDETMHLVPVGELPEQSRRLVEDRAVRCIYRDKENKTYTAYKLGVSRRIIHFHCDAGGDALLWKLYALQNLSVRGTVRLDHAHRRDNAWKDSVAEAGMKWLLGDMALLTSVSSAPWKQSGHFRKWSESAAEYLANFSEQDGLFQLLLPLCTERLYKGMWPSGWKDKSHARDLFEHMRVSGALNAKGIRARLGRWFQVPNRFREISTQLGFVVLAIAYAALTMGWTEHFSEGPLATLGEWEALTKTFPC
eukprot:6029843-Amphidinium_carterae.1